MSAPDPSSLKHDASLVGDWERALARDLGSSSGAWQMYAQARLNELAPVKPVAAPKGSKKPAGHAAPVRPGSDPYVNEGTDLTVILRVKDHNLLNASLSADLVTLGTTPGAITQSKVRISGVDVSLASSADGTVRQERATIGDLEFVSNSAQAIKRVIEATQGKRPRLSDEPDFQFLLARDASTRGDVLAYAGDRFVGEVIGPRQKIGEARRQLALSELLTPGFSSLLFGYMFGEAPFRGARDHASDPRAMRHLAFAYFGATPLAMDGGAYTLSPEGLRDPVRGDPYNPIWPALPVAGSPMAALMGALAHARAELSFDAEGSNSQGKKMRSLHARIMTRIDN